VIQPGSIRVALCDDHRIVRTGLRRILEVELDIVVVGEASTAAEAVAIAEAHQPDVFVMDLGLPDVSGIIATADVRRTRPDTRVLVLTVHDDVAHLRRAFEAGADGYLVKDAADTELCRRYARSRRDVSTSTRRWVRRFSAPPQRPASAVLVATCRGARKTCCAGSH